MSATPRLIVYLIDASQTERHSIQSPTKTKQYAKLCSQGHNLATSCRASSQVQLTVGLLLKCVLHCDVRQNIMLAGMYTSID